jgi:hypothetical protein
MHIIFHSAALWSNKNNTIDGHCMHKDVLLLSMWEHYGKQKPYGTPQQKYSTRHNMPHWGLYYDTTYGWYKTRAKDTQIDLLLSESEEERDGSV